MKNNEEYLIVMKAKYPELDIDKIISLFDEEIKRLKDSMPEQLPEHMHEMRLPLDCHLNKNIFFVVMSNYLKQKQENDTV